MNKKTDESLSGLRILVIEDSQLYQDLIARTLEKEGHQCEAALDGESAIEKVKIGNYDMVFLDLKLPGKDGFEIHTLFKEMSPDLKVVFITGNSSRKTIDRMKAADAFGYIVKPFELDKIRDVVSDIVGGSTAGMTQRARKNRMTDNVRGRVLVMAAEEFLANKISSALGEDGYDVAAAQDVDVGLGKIENDRFDLVLVDMRMPEMDGLRILERIRVLDDHVAVLLLTDTSSPSRAVEGVKLGADGYITKPFQHNQEVLSIIDAAVIKARHRGRAELEGEGQRIECEQCHYLFRMLSWHPGTECPGCGLKTTFPTVLYDDLDDHQPAQAGESPLKGPRFGRIARWGELITAGQLVECLVLQWEAKESGRPARHLGEMMIEKGYLTKREVGAILKIQASGNSAGEESRFGRIALQNGFINENQLGRCIATQAKLTLYGGKPPCLEYIMMEKGHMLEAQVTAVLKLQARKFHEGLLERLEKQSMSPTRRVTAQWSYVRQKYPKLHAWGLTGLLIILIVFSFAMFGRVHLFEQKIRVIDESGKLHRVSSRNLSRRSKKLGEKLYYALYCERCAVYFSLDVEKLEDSRYKLKPCPECGKLDETELPERMGKTLAGRKDVTERATLPDKD